MLRHPARLVLLALLAWLVAAPGASAAPAPVPCSNSGGGKFTCQWYPPGDGIHGGAKVMAGGRVVGYLHRGSNWIVCQQQGATVRNAAGNLNNWYGWTQADNGRWGWASPLEARGGGNFGPFSGAPNCGGRSGPAPSQGGVWGAAPAAPLQLTRPNGLKRQPACTKLREGQRLHVRGRYRQVAYTEYYSGGGRPTSTTHRELAYFGIGSVDIRLATCKTSSGRWRLIDPVNIRPDYEGIDAAGNLESNRSRGWGLAPRTITSSTLSLSGMRCSDEGLLSVGKLLLGVPLPISFWVDVGRFLASSALPDPDVRCQELTRLNMRLKIDKKSGKVALRDDVGHWQTFQDRGQREPNEKQVWEHGMSARG